MQDTDGSGSYRARQRAREVERYREALDRTHDLINPLHQRSATFAEVQALAKKRSARLRAFLAFLSNPERAFPTIHVAGTSGKGSTATLTAAILAAAGYRTGLHTSPYLQVATEKLQIDGKLISAADFAELVDDTLRLADRFLGGEKLTYGELWAAISFRWFADQQVDMAVIEVGAGGRFDLTNVISPMVSVITSVGMDHMETLGPTLRDVAWHKAGIIKARTPVVTGVVEPESFDVIRHEAERQDSPITVIRQGTTYEVETGEEGGQTLLMGGRRWPLPGAAAFQGANAALALATIDHLAGFGPFEPAHVAAGLQTRIPGRAEFVQRKPDVLLDGAHNPQKIAALAESLPELLPRRAEAGGRLVALVGSLATKRQSEMFRPLFGAVDELVVTEQPVAGKPAMPIDTLAQQLRQDGFSGAIHQEPEAGEALDLALSLLDAKAGDALLVTGSLFLVGAVRSRWYPDEEIVLQRTPWPDRASWQRRQAEPGPGDEDG